jgi:membrane protease YdiL (CAAX protease family)
VSTLTVPLEIRGDAGPKASRLRLLGRSGAAFVGPMAAGLLGGVVTYLLHGRGQMLNAGFYLGLLAGVLLVARWLFRGQRWGITGALSPGDLLAGAGFAALRVLPWVLLIRVVGVSPGASLLVPALYFLLVAASEEALFRGVLYQQLMLTFKRLPLPLAITAVLFASGHLLSAGLLFLPVFVADGVALGALRSRTGTIYPGIAGHWLLNLSTAGLLISVREVSDAVAIGYTVSVCLVDAAYAFACLRRPAVHRLAVDDA